MEKFNRCLFKKAFLRTSKLAVFCLSLSFLSLLLGLVINKVLAVNWQGPTANPPDQNVEPPINTSNLNQEKEGGFDIATVSGKVGIGPDFFGISALPTKTLDVDGTIHATGAVTFDSGLTAGDTTLSSLYATGNVIVNDNLTVDTDTLVVDSDNDKVSINTSQTAGRLNIDGGVSLNAIYAKNNNPEADGGTIMVLNTAGGGVGVFSEAEYPIYGSSSTNTGVYGAGAIFGVWGYSGNSTGVYGSGSTYGVKGESTSGTGVYGIATNGQAGVWGEGISANSATGVVGRGRTGIFGVDNNETSVGNYFTPLAGWFKGDVVIEDSIEPTTYGDLTIADGDLTVAQNLTVDTDTLYVQSSTDRVGIGTLTPQAKLHVEVPDYSDIAAIYAYAGHTNSNSWGNGVATTIAGVYAEGGDVAYGATGINFGVYGKAGTSYSGQTVAIYGITNDSTSSYAGFFKGPVKIENNGLAAGTLNVASALTVSSGGAAITGATSINGTTSITGNTTITGTASISGNTTIGAIATVSGALKNQGGLEILGDDTIQATSCQSFPSTNLNEGRMFICKYCEDVGANVRYHRDAFIRVGDLWFRFADDYIPEVIGNCPMR